MFDAKISLLKAKLTSAFSEKAYEKLKILGHEPPVIDHTFLATFPQLSALIHKASVVNFSIDESLFTFLSWTDREGHPCGILTEKTEDSNAIDIITEHAMLTAVLGEVVEYFSDFDKGIFANYNFLFGSRHCEAFKDSAHYPYYIENCNRLHITPMASENFIVFGVENGNLVMYDANTREVYLFAPDHCFMDLVKCVEGQAEYSFYQYVGVKTFTDFVEKFAQTWLEKI
jgi:hypothetical protein